MNNAEVRFEIIKSGLRNYQIAMRIGLSEANFSRMLRYELSPENRDRIMQAIAELTAEREGV